METINRLTGTKDFRPSEWRRLSIIQARLETFFDRRGYEVISTPLLEATDLFMRKSGGELAAQMYSFTDPSGRNVSLRPEFTASIVRGYLEGSLRSQIPIRLQYCGSVFRYEENPDSQREFTQFGAEVLGAIDRCADAEIVAFSAQALSALGIQGHRIRIGHIGVINALFTQFRLSERARMFLISNLHKLDSNQTNIDSVRSNAIQLGLLPSPDTESPTIGNHGNSVSKSMNSPKSFVERSLIDTQGQRTAKEVLSRYKRKQGAAEDASQIDLAMEFAVRLRSLPGSSTQTFMKKLKSLISEFGLDQTSVIPLEELLADLDVYDLGPVPVTLDLSLVRGFTYYTGPVFELEHRKVSGRLPLGGGGRYDTLVRALGGQSDIPALGFAYTLEVISSLLPKDFGDDEEEAFTRVLVVAAEAPMAEAVKTAERLRVQGIPAEVDIVSETESDAARYAERRGITTVVRVGRDGTTREEQL